MTTVEDQPKKSSRRRQRSSQDSHIADIHKRRGKDTKKRKRRSHDELREEQNVHPCPYPNCSKRYVGTYGRFNLRVHMRQKHSGLESQDESAVTPSTVPQGCGATPPESPVSPPRSSADTASVPEGLFGSNGIPDFLTLGLCDDTPDVKHGLHEAGNIGADTTFMSMCDVASFLVDNPHGSGCESSVQHQPASSTPCSAENATTSESSHQHKSPMIATSQKVVAVLDSSMLATFSVPQTTTTSGLMETMPMQNFPMMGQLVEVSVDPSTVSGGQMIAAFPVATTTMHLPPTSCAPPPQQQQQFAMPTSISSMSSAQMKGAKLFGRNLWFNNTDEVMHFLMTDDNGCAMANGNMPGLTLLRGVAA